MRPDLPTPTIIDLEASGFGRDSYPIEVGFVTADGEGWCSLIRPEEGWEHWDDSAEQLHHISRDQLKEHGHTAAFVAEQLNHYLAGSTVYTDGWGHDYPWLMRLFDSAGRIPFFKVQDLRHVLSAGQLEAWQRTKEQILRELAPPRHRASMDARVLQMTWLKTREFA